MNWKLCWPYGNTKALTFSYDDGQIHDRRLVQLFNKYSLKATFHLNSGTLGTPGFIAPGEVPALYENHEVACHGYHHRHLTHLSESAIAAEIFNDRAALENLLGGIVTGHSYAFGSHSPQVCNTLASLGITYSRTVNSTHNYAWPTNFLQWHPSCHHNEGFAELADRFLEAPGYSECALLYVWGHSYEFERDQNWDVFENICAKLAHHTDVWYATNIELQRYIIAARALQSNARGTILRNAGGVDIWVMINGDAVAIKSGEIITT